MAEAALKSQELLHVRTEAGPSTAKRLELAAQKWKFTRRTPKGKKVGEKFRL